MWSNDATVGIEARGDPRTPTIAHRPPKLKVLKRRSFHHKNSPRGQCEFERTHSKHRFVSSTSLSVLYAQRGAARARAARAGRRHYRHGESGREGDRRPPELPSAAPPSHPHSQVLTNSFSHSLSLHAINGGTERSLVTRTQGWARVRGLHTRSKIA